MFDINLNIKTANIKFPSSGDWVFQGTGIAAGSEGAWDARLEGMLSPCGIIKIDSTYYMYYIGADGDRVQDGGPKHRALGVAYSSDGVSWVKYTGNPIITFLPEGAGGVNIEEEGVFSAGIFYDKESRYTYITWGGMTAHDADEVRIDGFISSGSNPFEFSNNSAATALKIIDTDDQSFAGFGNVNDELFTVGLTKYENKWLLFYQTKNATNQEYAQYYVTSNTPSFWSGVNSNTYLNRATNPLGGDYRNLSVNKFGHESYFTTSVAYNSTQFLTELQTRQFMIDIVSPSAIINRYPLPTGKQYGIVFADEAAQKWIMAYRSDATNQDPILIKTAPLYYT